MKTATAMTAVALVLALAGAVGSQVTEEWVVRYSGAVSPMDVPDWAYAVTTDDDGNIYVTGGSWGSGTDDDCATIKYAPDGTLLWENRYHNSAEDWGYAITVDADGHAYVTGLSTGDNGYDYLTIKYDLDGERLWVRRYDGTATGTDAAYAICVDASGNVYVTGRSEVAPAGDNNYVTIKYASDGTPLWTASYNQVPAGDDRAHALTLDEDGNVYVTGGSEGASYDMDYATIKYDNAGNQIWVATSPGAEGTDGGGWGVAVDAVGDIVVTGRSNQDSTGYDFKTIKYDAAGVHRWTETYDGPQHSSDAASGLVVDADRNVYVTGRSEGAGTGFDYCTVKYDPDGVEQWVRRYDGPASGRDRPYGIALGGDNSVSVVGYSEGEGTGEDFATVKYDLDGVEQWARRFDGDAGGHDWGWAVATDPAGNVIAAGRAAGFLTGLDYTTIKYSSDGAELWVNHYGVTVGSGNQDWAYAMVVDDSGNSYVTGGSLLPGTDDDIVTFKYDTDGSVVWSVSYDGPASGEDWGYAIAVDDGGCVYLTGLSDGVGTGRDFVTIKYDANGLEQWVSRYDGPATGAGYDAAYTIAVDGSGNVLVAGNSAGNDPNSSLDFATVKYGPDGMEQWVARYDHGWDDDRARAVAAAPDGSVYVTGGSYTGSRYDIVTIKYAPDGTELWVDSSQGGTDPDGGGWAIDVGPEGDVWVGGRALTVRSSFDMKTLRYDSSGTLEWEVLYDGPDSGADKVSDLVVDDSGSAYVTGYSDGGDDYDYATVKYNASGTLEWVARYDGPGAGDDRPYQMTLTPSGGVAVTGKSTGIASSHDYATVCYSGAGGEEWTMRYDGPGGWDDWGQGIGVDATGNIYVTGKSHGIDSDYDYATIKYAVDTGTPVEGYCYAAVTESGGVRLRWGVARLEGISSFDVWRSTSDDGPFARVNDAPIAAEENSVFEDASVWPDTRFWYEVRARLVGGGEEPLSGGPVSVRTGGTLQTALHTVAPNPIPGSTVLQFDVADHTGPVNLTVYNARGQIVRSIVNGPLGRGRHVRTWEGTNERGDDVASGVYFVRLVVDTVEDTEKVLLLK